MRLRRLTATFGCLDGAVLEPNPGLSRYVLPNESGKSTWSAFLLAMFYGIDTSRRSSKGRPAEKTRYVPWNGKPMSGTIELEWQGRTLVLQRTSDHGRPLGDFRAYDKDTGLDIPGLTGDNCGRKLLGVERSVFERSAFLSGSELAVSQDQDLARRLSDLAATGSQSDSYPAAEARLKLWQNRCRYHKTGRIPETEEALALAREKYAAVEELRQQRLQLASEQERVREQLVQARAEQNRQQRDRKTLLRNTLEQANGRYGSKSAQAAALPEEDELRRLLLQLQRMGPEEGPEPPCPQALQGLSAEEIWPRVERDLQQYDGLRTVSIPKTGLRLLAAILPLVLAVVLASLKQWLLCGAAVLLTALGLCWWLAGQKRRKAAREQQREAQNLLEAYGVSDREALTALAMARRDWLRTHEQLLQQSWEQEVVLQEVQRFAPEAENRFDAEAAIGAALRLRQSVREAEADLERAQLQVQLADLGPDSTKIEPLERKLLQLQTQSEGLLSQEQAYGDDQQLQQNVRQLEEQLQDLERREQALILAREALASANEEMTQGYAPRLTGLGGTYLARLTEGRYDALILKQDLELSVRERDTGLVRPLALLSRGTQDQCWLALRLAMTRLLLPEGTPLVLDDALLTFDSQREQAAWQVLREEGRQVLLFSCR